MCQFHVGYSIYIVNRQAINGVDKQLMKKRTSEAYRAKQIIRQTGSASNVFFFFLFISFMFCLSMDVT